MANGTCIWLSSVYVAATNQKIFTNYQTLNELSLDSFGNIYTTLEINHGFAQEMDKLKSEGT